MDLGDGDLVPKHYHIFQLDCSEGDFQKYKQEATMNVITTCWLRRKKYLN